MTATHAHTVDLLTDADKALRAALDAAPDDHHVVWSLRFALDGTLHAQDRIRHLDAGKDSPDPVGPDKLDDQITDLINMAHAMGMKDAVAWLRAQR